MGRWWSGHMPATDLPLKAMHQGQIAVAPRVQASAREACGLRPDRGKLPGPFFTSHLHCVAGSRPAHADGHRWRPADGAAQAARTAMQSWLEWLRQPYLHHNQSRQQQQQPSGSSSTPAITAQQQLAGGETQLGRALFAVPPLALHKLPPPSDSSQLRLSGRSRAGRFVESSVEYSTEHSRGSGTAAGATCSGMPGGKVAIGA